jgi:hypothetical protein
VESNSATGATQRSALPIPQTPLLHDWVTAASPGPRIEMLARQKRDGFDVSGNEVSVVI